MREKRHKVTAIFHYFPLENTIFDYRQVIGNMSVIGQVPGGSRIGTIANGWSQWGRSSITVVAMPSSPSSSSYGSLDSYSSSNSWSSSKSPVPQSPDLRSERASGPKTPSPSRRIRKTFTIKSKDIQQRQQQPRRRSWSSSQQSQESKDDLPDEITTNTSLSPQPSPGRRKRLLLSSRQSFSSCPELGTIDEEKTSEEQLEQERRERRERNAKFVDPYNDPYDDDDDLDCVDCWSFHKSGFQTLLKSFGNTSKVQDAIEVPSENKSRSNKTISVSKPRRGVYRRQTTV